MQLSRTLKGRPFASPKTAAIAVSLDVLISAALFLALLVDGYQAPLKPLYFLLQPWAADATPYVSIAPAGVLTPWEVNVEAARDIAFEWYNVKPEARARLQEIPVRNVGRGEWAGAYDIGANTVFIAGREIDIFLHEYAHANMAQWDLGRKLQTAFNLGRLLLLDGDARNAEARGIVKSAFEASQAATKYGKFYNPLWEAYAYLAQWSQGDLSKIPSYLQGSYNDYLQTGPNNVTRRAS